MARSGFTTLGPDVRTAILTRMQASNPFAGGSLDERGDLKSSGQGLIAGWAAQNYADAVMSEGFFTNATVKGRSGYAYYDPKSNGAVAGPDGQPLFFTLDEVVAAGTQPPRSAWGRAGAAYQERGGF